MITQRRWLGAFKTKGEALEFLRGMRDEYLDGRDLAPDDLAIMGHVLSYHGAAERKIGAGLAAMYVAPDPGGYGTRGFWIRRVDGTCVDFSWNECLKNWRPIDKLRDAGRRAISDQIAAYTKTAACGCGSRLALQVDHVQPFSVLFDAWLSTLPGTPEVREDDGAHVGDAFARSSDAAAWAHFHAEHALLQTLCRSCNARKGARA